MFLDAKQNGSGMDYTTIKIIEKELMPAMKMTIILTGIVPNVSNVPIPMETI